MTIPSLDFNIVGGELSDCVDVKVNGKYLVAEQGATFLRYSVQVDEKSRSATLKMTYGIGKKEPFYYELTCDYRLYAGETRLERSATLVRASHDRPITLPRLPPTPEDDPRERAINLDLENVDLYTALNLLFEQAKVLHSVNPALKGDRVTARIHKPFIKALEALLIASGQPLTYQVEDGVYSAIPIQERDDYIVRVNVNNSNAYEALKQVFEQKGVPYSLDARLQLATLNAQFEMPFKRAIETIIKRAQLPYVYRITEGVHQLAPEESPALVEVDADNVDAYEALETALKKAKVLYAIDSALHNAKVTVHLRLPFHAALEAVLRASGLPFGYRIDNGVYRVGYVSERIEGFRFGLPRFLWHGCQIEAPGPVMAGVGISPTHFVTDFGDKSYQLPSAPDIGFGLVALVHSALERSFLFWMDAAGGETRYQPSLKAIGVTPFIDLAFEDQRPQWIGEGVGVKSGTMRMEATHGDLSDGLLRFRHWASRSFASETTAPDWAREGALLEVALDKFKGGFKEITAYLPFYKGVGFDTLMLTPHGKGGYAALNPAEIEPKYGTQAELKTLVATAHKLGMKALFGMTIDGFDEKSPAIGLRNMFITTDFNTLERQGGIALVNRAEPQYQDYLRLLAQSDLQIYDMDGYRIERANYQAPMWRTGWNQPAYAAGNQSPLAMQIVLNALREKKSQSIILSGETGMVFHSSANLVQDATASGSLHFQELLRNRKATAKDYKLHIANTRDALPPGAARVYASRSYATEALAKFAGDAPLFRALEAVHAFCGVPQVYAEAPQENPRLFEFYRKLFAIRKRFPELTRGDLYLREADADSPEVFSAIRKQGDATTWVLISMSDKPLSVVATTSLAAPLPTLFLDVQTGATISARKEGARSLKITIAPGQILIGNREIERAASKIIAKR